jgi:ferredoxin
VSEEIWRQATQASINMGVIPMPITDTLLTLMKTIVDEREARFISQWSKPMSWDEIRQTTDLRDDELESMLEALMMKGVITGIPSKTTGTVVYRLLPPIPGLFEFTLMRGEKTPREKKLARLFHQLFREISDMVQNHYEPVVDFLKTVPPITRVIPVQQEVGAQKDDVLPYEDVKKIIERFEKIAVSTCYCRHEKDLLGEPCQVTRERENCFIFGQTAEFVIRYRFGRQISKQEAFNIMEKARDDGLVHKAFHVKQDIRNEEYAICNCCRCCCGTFQIYHLGGAPMQTYSSYLAEVKSAECTGCGVCLEKCPMEAVRMAEDTAVIDEKKCIGCGVCAHQCPASAITLKRTGMRDVFVPPPRKKSIS